LTLLGAALFSAGALAAGYQEKKSGDLSNDGLNPTPVKLKVGANIIDGNDGSVNGVVDRDYFTFTLKAGQQLTSITLEPKTVVGGTFSFIGVQKGKQVTVDPNGNSPAGLLGWTHYSDSEIGTDLLPAICTGPGAKGCTPPLGKGSYSFWLQELSACACHYRFTFNVTGSDDAATSDETDADEE
jgi:hypothetical protein